MSNELVEVHSSRERASVARRSKVVSRKFVKAPDFVATDVAESFEIRFGPVDLW